MKLGVSIPDELVAFADEEALPRRGEVWWVRLDKRRPAVVVQRISGFRRAFDGSAVGS